MNQYEELRTKLIPEAEALAEAKVSKKKDLGKWSAHFSEAMDRLSHEKLGVTATWLRRELKLQGRCPKCGSGGACG